LTSIVVVVPPDRGCRRYFDYLRLAAAREDDVEIRVVPVEAVRAGVGRDADALVVGDVAYVDAVRRAGVGIDAVVVHDLGPHRVLDLFDGLYLPANVDRRVVEDELERSVVIVPSVAMRERLCEVLDVEAEVVEPGVDEDVWRCLAASGGSLGVEFDVGAIVPVGDAPVKGLPFVAEVARRDLDVVVVTDVAPGLEKASLERNAVHLARAAKAMVFSPNDQELAAVYSSVRVWVAPGEEGFGLAPLEAAAVGAMPVWTFDPEAGPDPSKPREFQVARSVKGAEDLEKLVERPVRFDLEKHGFTVEEFLVRFLHALGF